MHPGHIHACMHAYIHACIHSGYGNAPGLADAADPAQPLRFRAWFGLDFRPGKFEMQDASECESKCERVEVYLCLRAWLFSDLLGA